MNKKITLIILLSLIGFLLGIVWLFWPIWQWTFRRFLQETIMGCNKLRNDLIQYIETHNYCETEDDCYVVRLADCKYHAVGKDADLEYIEKINSEFGPKGKCWSGILYECVDPHEAGEKVCENNKCRFKKRK